jgi:hypothetical protein
LCVGRKKQNQPIPKKERKQKSSLLDCPPLWWSQSVSRGLWAGGDLAAMKDLA